MKTITLCYVHVPNCVQHLVMAKMFLDSYNANPPGVEHNTILICQGQEPCAEIRTAFSTLPGYSEYIHDDSGWDIGAYMAVAKSDKVHTPAMLCCGGSTTFRKAGWMKRLHDAWAKYGSGFYGTLSSFQARPHFNTNGFMTAPYMLASYPFKVETKEQRYEFEHGRDALWWRLNQLEFPTKLVTWDGEYDWKEWRKPDNISCRGDQSNCLIYFRINYQFDVYCQTDLVAKNNLMYLTDAHVTDPWWREQLKGLTPLGVVVEG